MNKARAVILTTIALDALGGGLIIPILPELLEQLSANGDMGLLYGFMIAVYAGMQFLFSPALGVLSDRLGRRPVLLVSLAGALVDYLFMAFSPWGWALVAGRTIAGLTSASMAVATAYITDITAPEDRARQFGRVGAVMGLAFVIGPVLGGVLSTTWLRMPFLAAALLNGINLLVALFVLPESRKPGVEAKPLAFADLNPLAALAWLGSFRRLAPLVAVLTVFSLIAMVPPTIWSLYSMDRLGWDPMTIGLSMAVFGLCMAFTQAVLTGWFISRFGDFGTVLLGVAFDAMAFMVMGLADTGWVAFVAAPLFSLGGIIMPAMQSLVTRAVPDESQGKLQGVLTSLQSVAAVTGPVLCTAGYFATRTTMPGFVWLAGAGLYAVALLGTVTLRARLDPAYA